MATEDKTLLAFNRGVISSRGLARVDLERMAMSAEIQSNFIPRVLGSMMLRPGFEYIDNTDQNFQGRLLSFTFGVDDTAQIELTDSNMRVRIDDVLITRPSVSSAIANGDFTGTVPDANWTDESDAGGTATWDGANFAQVYGDGTDFGRFQQEVTVSGGDIGVEHAVRFTVTDGPLLVKIGSSSGDDDYVREARLDSGIHSLAFTPTGNFFIQFANEREFIAWVDAVEIEAAGVMEIETPWALNELPSLRWDQSGDVIYLSGNTIDPPLPAITTLPQITALSDPLSHLITDVSGDRPIVTFRFAPNGDILEAVGDTGSLIVYIKVGEWVDDLSGLDNTDWELRVVIDSEDIGDPGTWFGAATGSFADLQFNRDFAWHKDGNGIGTAGSILTITLRQKSNPANVVTRSAMNYNVQIEA